MKKILILLAATIALAACNNDTDNEPASAEALKITASIGESALSRAAGSDWSENDEIGISSTVGGVAGPFINYKYTTDGDGEFSGTPIFFYKPMTLTAYYPFTGSETKAPGTNGVIAASTGAAYQTPDNQPKIDFLWDSRTGIDNRDFSVSDTTVNFTFAHKMAKLSFTFLSSKEVRDDNGILISNRVDVGTMVSYRIEGLGIEGTFDTNTGVCAIDESKHDGLTIEFEKKSESMETRSFPSLIVFPQTNDNGYTLRITTDELEMEGSPHQDYKCQLQFAGNEIKPGYHYSFTVKVTRRGLMVGKLSIEPWEQMDNFMTATIDGGEKEFQEN